MGQGRRIQINGLAPAARLEARQRLSAPLVESYMENPHDRIQVA